MLVSTKPNQTKTQYNKDGMSVGSSPCTGIHSTDGNIIGS